MPICRKCQWFNKDVSDCHAPGYDSELRRVTLMRRCIFGAITENLNLINGKVLEVGHGKVFFLRKRVKRKKSFWYGLEPRWAGGEPQNKMFDGTVSKMPFDNTFFDCVVCSQSIEHWHEFGDTIESGLKEIYRVLKPSGLLFIDVPIHSHGSRIFIIGNMNEIKNIFDKTKWEIIKFEERRKIYEPLKELPTELKYRKYAIENSGQIIPSEWILNIVVKKI
jgi:SAM-dependent methyltransferase